MCAGVIVRARARVCVYTMGPFFPKSQRCFRSAGICSALSFFFWLQHLFYYWQVKIGLGFVATTTSSELYCQNFGLLFFFRAQVYCDWCEHSSDTTLHKKERKKLWQKSSEKDRMMKGLEKINHYISLVLEICWSIFILVFILLACAHFPSSVSELCHMQCWV